MEFTGTVERLMNLLEVKAELDARGNAFGLQAVNRLIETQVDKVKINVMTYAFDGLDYFNSKTFAVDPEAYDAVIQDSLDKETL